MKANALSYLLAAKIKNNLKNFIKKPARLVYVIIVLALLGATVIGGSSGASDPDRQVRDLGELTAVLNALLILMFSTTFYSGLQSGGSIFKMTDVNFLFPSPLNKRSILFFALIQQIGTSMLVGIFILFQYTTLHINYDLSGWGLLLIFLVYSIVVFISQSCAMFLYTFISDSDKKKSIAKRVFLALIILLVAYVGVGVLQNRENILPSLVEYGNSLPVKLFPFAGWLGAFAEGMLTADYPVAVMWFALSAAAFGAAVYAISASKREYYEDVIASAETMQSAIVSAKEGVAPEAAPRHIRVGKTGIGKGEGAPVIFYKHMLENRRSASFVLSPTSLIFALMSIAFAFFFRKAGLLVVFGITAYAQVISVTGGRFARELMKPYVYLMPEPPLKKMIWTLMESMPTSLLEGIIIFVPVTVIMGAGPLEGFLCIVARLSFAAVFISGNLLIERIWGGELSKVAGVFLYFIVNIILCVPGIVLAAVLSLSGAIVGSAVVTALLALTVCNIPVAILVLFLCRNALQYSEMR